MILTLNLLYKYIRAAYNIIIKEYNMSFGGQRGGN